MFKESTKGCPWVNMEISNNNCALGMNCTVIRECGDVMTGLSSRIQHGRSTLKQNPEGRVYGPSFLSSGI